MTTSDTPQTGPERGTQSTGRQEKGHGAGAFDIRTFIAVLIGLYGVVLVLTGMLGTSQADLDRAGGMNINLFAGGGMLAVSAAFLIWARLRPVVVPDEETSGSPSASSSASREHD